MKTIIFKKYPYALTADQMENEHFICRFFQGLVNKLPRSPQNCTIEIWQKDLREQFRHFAVVRSETDLIHYLDGANTIESGQGAL